MMGRREQGGKDYVGKNEGRNIKCDSVLKVPELMVSQGQMKKREADKEKEKNKNKRKKVVGWSTERMGAKTSKREFEDTEGMVQWRSVNQES